MSGALDDLRLEANDALFLDFDGTLAELIDDPDAVRLDPDAAAALDQLIVRLGGAVILLSGRDLRDLGSRVPPTFWRAGGHGLEILAPGEPLPPPPPPPSETLLDPLRAAVARFPGARIEIKGPVAAVHFRAIPEAEAELIAAAQALAAEHPGLIHQAGKMVVEIKPETAHKGSALRHMMTRAPFAGRRPVMLGDDTTDEDAIAAAQDLGGIGVKIGTGISVARLRAPDPAAVRAWLAREAG